MKLKDWLLKIYRTLDGVHGSQKCFLEHADPFQLMICAILSAQCSDAKVNALSPKLFRIYPDLKSFAEAGAGELEKVIKPCGLHRTKAKNIIGACGKILKDFGGKIPSEMEKLTLLPGIGRKTANVILGHAFGKPGFPVDTHVLRLLNRIGIVNDDNPVRIEFVVNKNLSSKYWSEFSLLLIAHGRSRCTARKPDCQYCEIRKLCRRIFR